VVVDGVVVLVVVVVAVVVVVGGAAPRLWWSLTESVARWSANSPSGGLALYSPHVSRRPQGAAAAATRSTRGPRIPGPRPRPPAPRGAA